MIKIETVRDNVIRVTAPEKLKADDFQKIAPQVDLILQRYGKVKLLIDATAFNGWENIAAFEHHAAFVKSHQQKVDRLAVIVAHDWQHWLVGAVRVFLHPQVRAYDKGHESEACNGSLNSRCGKLVADMSHAFPASWRGGCRLSQTQKMCCALQRKSTADDRVGRVGSRRGPGFE